MASLFSSVFFFIIIIFFKNGWFFHVSLSCNKLLCMDDSNYNVLLQSSQFVNALYIKMLIMSSKQHTIYILIMTLTEMFKFLCLGQQLTYNLQRIYTVFQQRTRASDLKGTDPNSMDWWGQQNQMFCKKLRSNSEVPNPEIFLTGLKRYPILLQCPVSKSTKCKKTVEFPNAFCPP